MVHFVKIKFHICSHLRTEVQINNSMLIQGNMRKKITPHFMFTSNCVCVCVCVCVCACACARVHTSACAVFFPYNHFLQNIFGLQTSKTSINCNVFSNAEKEDIINTVDAT